MSIEVKSVKRMTTRSKTHQLLAQQQQQQQQLQHEQQEVEVSSTTVILADVDDILPSPLTDVCEDSLLAVSVSSPLLSTCTFGSNEPTLSNDIDDDAALLSSSAVDDMLDDKVNEPVIVNEIKCISNSILDKSSCNSTSSCNTSAFIANNDTNGDASTIIDVSNIKREATVSLLQQAPQQPPPPPPPRQLHLITTTSASGTSALVVSSRVVSISNSASASGNSALTTVQCKGNAVTADQGKTASTDTATALTASAAATTAAALLTGHMTKVTTANISGTINSQGSSAKGRSKSTEAAGSKGNDCKIKVHCSHLNILPFLSL